MIWCVDSMLKFIVEGNQMNRIMIVAVVSVHVIINGFDFGD